MRYVIVGNHGGDSAAERDGYRAYFYWRDGDHEREEVLSVAELEAEIDRLKGSGKPTGLHEAALKRLRTINALA